MAPQKLLQLALIAALVCMGSVPRVALGIRLFVLGDSLLDTGNSVALAPPVQNYSCNFPPYGRDFPGGATGRCSNGKNLVDFISKALEFPDAPPGPLQTGVSYSTGSNAATAGAPTIPANNYGVSTYSGDVQLAAIKKIIWNGATPSGVLKDVLLFIDLGSNDLINFYRKFNFFEWVFRQGAYTTAVVKALTKLVQDAYAFGVRNVIIANMSPEGCSPVLRSIAKAQGYPFSGCVGPANTVAKSVNDKLESALKTLRKQIPRARIILKDTWAMYYEAAKLTGLSVSDERCCGSGLSQCGMPGTFLCTNATKYFYWDGAHPAEYTTTKFFDLLWTGNTAFMRTMNASTLIKLMKTD